MKRIFITAIFFFMAGGAALAADLPPAPQPLPRAPAVYMPAPTVYNWSGIYIGINGGWGWGNAKWTATPTGFATVTGTNNDNGGVVGGTLGANYQMGAVVFGIEGDWDYSGVSTGVSSTICGVGLACETGNHWLSTIRGRLGYAWDRVLFYGTAGGAFASVVTTFNGVNTTHTQDGWTAGLGLEYAFLDNWTAKVEYLYTDLGSSGGTCTTGPCAAGGAVGVPVTWNASLTGSLIRGGINYKFNF